MQSTALLPNTARVCDVDALLGCLATLADCRERTGLRYARAPVLLLIVLAKLAGEDHPSGIADWISSRGRQLRELLHLPWRRMPHHNTYRRILEHVVDPDALDAVVSGHLQSLPGVAHTVLIALDGKTCVAPSTRTARTPITFWPPTSRTKASC